MGAKCFDCGLSYGSIGWIEALIPDKVWDKIRPNGTSPGCGILCINCISKRLVIHGFENVPVWFCGTEPLLPISGDPNRDFLHCYDPKTITEIKKIRDIK